eukprot:47165_1
MKLHWQLLLGALGLCAIVGIGFGVKTLIGLSASEKSSAEFGLDGPSDKMRNCVVTNGVASWDTVVNPPTCSATAADLCEKLAIPKNIDLTNGELSIDSTTGLLPYLKLTCNAEFGLVGSSDKMRTCDVTEGVATWVTVENPPTCSANADCKNLAKPDDIDIDHGRLVVVDSTTGLFPYVKLICDAEFGLDGPSDKMRNCVVTNGVASWDTVVNPPTCSATATAAD